MYTAHPTDRAAGGIGVLALELYRRQRPCVCARRGGAGQWPTADVCDEEEEARAEVDD